MDPMYPWKSTLRAMAWHAGIRDLPRDTLATVVAHRLRTEVPEAWEAYKRKYNLASFDELVRIQNRVVAEAPRKRPRRLEAGPRRLVGPSGVRHQRRPDSGGVLDPAGARRRAPRQRKRGRVLLRL